MPNQGRIQIVCNTFAKGEWGKEERKSNPYKKGDDIDIRIRAHDSKFQIFVDQRAIRLRRKKWVSPVQNAEILQSACAFAFT
ncbi:galactoside-binding lectin [Ancylostoma ceylanicum]|uniref:Galectin n=1 Tax=Ancylostoma ceylanicum TaxID=53326 RepID=A0A0D6LFS9_9BILA|nr:galactoside-binding lectin [Ancylostoma ceylanicum]EPB68211.1 galactoside-binding lectin [Ancylostoma ceylanicum]